ncbi:MAG: preprotein translocase subunit SecG [Candidatus Omnitrophica bacterium]|nr:preprotein translocase subunit SecG [Candidatus Omnitrophota bacterium]
MMSFLITIHIIACFLLIVIVLIQQGRGGGLVEGFSGVESMFGTKTNVFLTRATAVLSIVFFVTCLSLAVLSARKSKSLMSGIKTKKTQAAQSLPKAQDEQAAPAAPDTQQQAPKETPNTPEHPKAE